MESKNHRHKPQASASLRPSISNSEHLIATSDLSIRHLSAPGLNGILQEHNSVNFKLIKTATNFIEQPQRTTTSQCRWFSTNDKTSVSILLKLRKISETHDVHFQWIPSHVNISSNEVADRLTKECSENEMASRFSLTTRELCSSEKSKFSLIWRIPPSRP
ncbi:hypothetical protein TNCV_4962911 [Trichonephila clavipes]|nr:hypothetical protein TNCV_4962911 [Trichonephila clavipes]